MTQSMTGFGKASRELDGDTVTVELSTVNHRFLDCCCHLPGVWSALEPAVKETVRKHLSRGRVNVWVMRKRAATSSHSVTVDRELAKQYIDAARELGHMLGSMQTLSLDVLAGLDGVLTHEDAQEDLDRAEAVVVDALVEAVTALNAMRAVEGEALEAELRLRIDAIREALATVEARLPDLEAAYEARLRARIEDLKAGAEVTEDRLALELAMLADKGDVTEETVRLKTHLNHAIELLSNGEPAGREINFLAQEIQREVNTLGSKIRDTEVAREVLRMKAELEKFREQAQNIE
ncbi:MAG: YicC family protein [Candidatus Hydrogenedentes bacterium]|nr:YicC family protein [Candidatus Hydrogenedentota bacterium]